MHGFIVSVPLFLPGLVLGLVVASLAARPLASHLGVGPVSAFLLAGSVALIVSATLTPGVEALRGEARVVGWCDLSRMGFASNAVLMRLDDASLNVLLFVPFGVLIGSLPSGSARSLLVIGGLSLPLAIELTQSWATILGRSCQSKDVFDDLMGLGLGLGAGLVLRTIVLWVSAAQRWRTKVGHDR
jgi:hypothetical protein